MNKSLCVILSLALASLSGCSMLPGSTEPASSDTSVSSDTSAETTEEPSSSVSSEDTTEASSSVSESETSAGSLIYEDQIRTFLTSSDKWRGLIPADCKYLDNEVAFTDLDGDGFVEMFVARLYDNSVDTTFELYEYNPDDPDGYEFIMDYTSDVNPPDIITNSIDAYYDGNTVLYTATDCTRGYGLVEYINKYFMTYDHDYLQFEFLGVAKTTTDEGGEFTEYTDAHNATLSEDEFRDLYDTQAGMRGNYTKTKLQLSWFPEEDIETASPAQLAEIVTVRPR